MFVSTAAWEADVLVPAMLWFEGKVSRDRAERASTHWIIDALVALRETPLFAWWCCGSKFFFRAVVAVRILLVTSVACTLPTKWRFGFL